MLLGPVCRKEPTSGLLNELAMAPAAVVVENCGCDPAVGNGSGSGFGATCRWVPPPGCGMCVTSGQVGFVIVGDVLKLGL